MPLNLVRSKGVKPEGLSSRTPVITASACVQPGTTPYGRGLVSQEGLVSGTRLLSTAFSQLLLVSDKVEGPYENVHKRFWQEHGVVPDDLLRFITGELEYLILSVQRGYDVGLLEYLCGL